MEQDLQPSNVEESSCSSGMEQDSALLHLYSAEEQNQRSHSRRSTDLLLAPGKCIDLGDQMAGYSRYVAAC